MTMRDIKVSVLIPAYNTEIYIGDCLKSLINQSFHNLEIIVVDDGSDDDTLSIAKNFAIMDSRIQVFTIPHSGVSVARNTCVNRATGEYIMFVDSDDFVDAKQCENLLFTAEKMKADIVLSPMMLIKSQGKEILLGDRSNIFDGNESISGIECFKKMVNSGCLHPIIAGNLYRKQLFNIGTISFDCLYHDDEQIMPFLLYEAKSVCYYSVPGYYRRNDSIIAGTSNCRDRAIILIKIANAIGPLSEMNKTLRHKDFRSAVLQHQRVLRNKALNLYNSYLQQSRNIKLLIFIEQSPSSQYGIGTYVKHLITEINEANEMIDVIIVELYSEISELVSFDSFDGQPMFRFNYRSAVLNKAPNIVWELSELGVFYYLASKIYKAKNVICHFNTFGHEILTTKFRDDLGAKIIFTVHYSSSSQWYGKEEIISINKAQEMKFKREQAFLNDYCDRVIAISQFSYDKLVKLYKIDPEKISLVFNKIDVVQYKHTKKNILRDYYGFSQDDKLIIYAGRLNVNKGIVNLLRAFKKLLFHIPNVKLIIAGSGEYNTVFSEIKPIWSKVYLTGFIEKKELYNLYRLSDLGVVPSYYEEFGYVAIEMMYNGLTVLVNDVGGLHEQANRSRYIHAISMTELSSEQLASEIESKLLYPERNIFLKMNKEQLDMSGTMGIIQVYQSMLTKD